MTKQLPQAHEATEMHIIGKLRKAIQAAKRKGHVGQRRGEYPDEIVRALLELDRLSREPFIAAWHDYEQKYRALSGELETAERPLEDERRSRESEIRRRAELELEGVRDDIEAREERLAEPYVQKAEALIEEVDEKQRAAVKDWNEHETALGILMHSWKSERDAERERRRANR